MTTNTEGTTPENIPPIIVPQTTEFPLLSVPHPASGKPRSRITRTLAIGTSTLALLFMTGLVALIYLSPWYCALRLMEAIQNHDAATIHRYADTKAIAESMKQNMCNDWKRQSKKNAASGFMGAIEDSFSTLTTLWMIDYLVTPDSVANMLVEGEASGLVRARVKDAVNRFAGSSTTRALLGSLIESLLTEENLDSAFGDKNRTDSPPSPQVVKCHYRNLNSFVVRSETPGLEKQTAEMIFARYGLLDWKLVSMTAVREANPGKEL
jgi:hypothetical protein